MTKILIFNKNVSVDVDEKPVQEVFDDTNKFGLIRPNFTGYADWEKSTNIHCLECTLKIIGTPWFIPGEIQPLSDEEAEYRKLGDCDLSFKAYFCGVLCAYRYICSAIRTEDKFQDACQKLKLLYEEFTGCQISEIPRGLPRSVLQKFGGQYTSNQFRTKNREIFDNSIKSINDISIDNFIHIPEKDKDKDGDKKNKNKKKN